MHVNGLKWAALLGCLVTGAASAQMLPVEDFSRDYEFSDVALSPDGRHVAMAAPINNGLETQLKIIPLDGGTHVQGLRFIKQQHVHDIVWASNDRVIVSRAEKEPLREGLVSRGELWSSDIRGKDQEALFAYIPDSGNVTGKRKDQGFADVGYVIDDEQGNVLVSFVCWPGVCGEESSTTIFKVDPRTGSRKELERISKRASYSFDRNQRGRLRVTSDLEYNPEMSYRPTPESDWKPVPASLAGYSMSGVVFEQDNNTAYALISDKQEPAKLYRVDFAAGTRTLLQGRDDVAITGYLMGGFHGVPFAVYSDADKPSIRYLDNTSEWAKFHAGLMKSFPGQMVSLIDFSRDNRTVLFATWSDRTPGAYYVINRDTNKVQLIGERAPWFKAEQMAATRPIEFTSQDGVKLFGFLTANPKATGPQPTVVLPHGGPYGPYDNWGFDSEAQFLASRGYAVLQINFRGSGGRGEAFERSGYGEWGGKLVDDVADGVKWAIANKLVDPNRICIYGASYGGYAALMGPIRYPDLYKCAIGYVGVYDLSLMRKRDMNNGTDRLKRFIDNTIGKDEAKLAAMSPARNVDKIRLPVFLVQGRSDTNVPMEQFNALKNAFEKQGTPVETMVVAGEGHGFVKPENVAELYRRLAAFLDKNMPK